MGAVTTQTFVFFQGAIPTVTQWNSNFVTLFSNFTNIDQNNIGPAGLLASQIKPSGIPSATFGGTAPYTFPNGVLSQQQGTPSYVPPLFFNSAVPASTAHMCAGSVSLTIATGNSVSSAVSLTGANAFTNASTYVVLLSNSNFSAATAGGTVVVVPFVTIVGGGSFVISAITSNTANVTSSAGPGTVYWVAIGS